MVISTFFLALFPLRFFLLGQINNTILADGIEFLKIGLQNKPLCVFDFDFLFIMFFFLFRFD